ILALEHHAHAAADLRGETGHVGERRRSSRVLPLQAFQLGPKKRIGPSRSIHLLQLLERGHERLRHVPAAVGAESPGFCRRGRHVSHQPLRLPILGTPTRSRTAAVGSAARATAVPTRTRSAPAAAARSTSARDSIPLSATAATPTGTSGSTRAAVSRSTVKVSRSLLFTPIAVGSAARARSISSGVWTSTNT